MSDLKFLNENGQSPWCDNLSRSLIDSGELKSLINSGILGVTSNPTIFDMAISSSPDYDSALKDCKAKGLSAEETYWELVCKDIADAADILKPIYDATQGRDGYISVEVSPLLARNTAETIAQANELYSRISRDNVMIKIPATDQGLPAIEAVLANAIPVNVTLIFSQERYLEVVAAYKKGIAQLNDQSKVPASVASFFISRLDTKVDAALEEGSEIAGQVAIANAGIVYKLFNESFSQDERETAQRPLWASTSAKNPSYSPTIYVYNLLANHTVNTLPQSTIEAIQGASGSDAEFSLASDTTKFEEIYETAKQTVPLAEIMQELENEGVEAFANSYRSCLSSISSRLEEI